MGTTWRTKLRMVWAILTCKKVSLYALHNTCGVVYETTVENTKAACTMACDMCMYAKTRYYRTPCVPTKHCSHYIQEDKE